MMTLRRFVCLLILAGLLVGPGVPALAAPYDEPPTLTLPAGTALPLVLQAPLSSDSAQVGQVVQAKLMQPIYVGEILFFPPNVVFSGAVTRLNPPQQGRNAVLAVEMTAVTWPNGAQSPIASRLEDPAKHGYWGGELTKPTQVNVIPYNVTGIGTYGRAFAQGPRAMGQAVIIPLGTRFVISLTAPLSRGRYF